MFLMHAVTAALKSGRAGICLICGLEKQAAVVNVNGMKMKEREALGLLGLLLAMRA